AAFGDRANPNPRHRRGKPDGFHMTKAKLTPKRGLVVPDPVTNKPLAPEGEIKVLNAYWRRRIKDGDVLADIADVKTVEKPKGSNR
ncbi:MAG: DUF2635 domain-containing protein, partial [Myxococcota bacterium]